MLRNFFSIQTIRVDRGTTMSLGSMLARMSRALKSMLARMSRALKSMLKYNGSTNKDSKGTRKDVEGCQK